jgi:hypothetical protein
VTLGSTHPLTEMNTWNISWRGRGDKYGRCVGLMNLPTSYVDCLEIWELQPRGNLRASPGLHKDCFTLINSKKQGLRDRLRLCGILTIIPHKYFLGLISPLKQKQFYTLCTHFLCTQYKNVCLSFARQLHYQ